MQQKHWDLRATVERGLSDPISYMNTNVLSPAQWEDAPQDVKDVFLDAARRIGFRFALSSVRVQQQLHLRPHQPSRLILSQTWENRAIAPCYESYALQFTLLDAQDNVAASELTFPHVPTTQWNPGQACELRTLLRVPAGLSPGEYRLAVAMLLPEKSGPPIQLAMAGADSQGRYPICDIPAVEAPVTDGVVLREVFDGNRTTWKAAPGITVEIDHNVAHSADACLRVEGAQERGWNYASGPRDIPVRPGSKYRLSCWVKVEELAPETLTPYLKLGIHDSNDEWLANISTSRYDMRHAGRWQQLTATAETPLAATSGQFALERGTNTTPSRLKVWLDDISLELLEGP